MIPRSHIQPALPLAAVLMAITFMTSVDARAETYDFDTYLAVVREHNHDLALAREDRESAAITEREARSGALPTVGLETSYTRNLTNYYMFFDKSALDPRATGSVKAPIKRDNETSTTLALEQTIYSSEVRYAITASHQYASLADEAYDATEQAVLNGAKKLFYQCLFLEQVRDVARAAETNAEDNAAVMQDRYDNGQVSRFELLQAETRWRSAIPETRKAERNLQLALNLLKNMAGIDPDADIELAGTLDRAPGMPAKREIENIYASRPDMRALDWERALRETNLSATEGAWQPKFSGMLAYNFTAQSDKFALEEKNRLWFAGITLSMPIYTGGYISAQVDKASVELKKTEVRIEKTKESVSTDVANAYLSLEEARQRIESAATTRNTADEAYRIAEIATGEGLATQLQLKDARLMFDQATVDYYAAVFDYFTAYFDWEYAVK